MDGGDNNIPFAFLKKRGDNNALQGHLFSDNFSCTYKAIFQKKKVVFMADQVH